MKPRTLSNCCTIVACLLPCTARAVDTYWTGGTGNWTSGNWSAGEPVYNMDAYLQNGGTTQVTTGNYETADDMYISSGSRLEISGGSLNMTNAGSRQFIGYIANTTGTISQSGGENAMGYHMYLGYAAGSTGTYTLTNGNVYVDNILYAGYDGHGVFQQSGGAVSIVSRLQLGYNAGSSGTYRLSGTGTLSVTNSSGIQVGTDSGTGRFEWFREGGVTADAMDFGGNGTLAMGYSFNSIPSIVNGLQNATLEVTNGATVTKVNDGITSSVNYLRFGSSTGEGYGSQTGGTVQIGQAAYIGDGGTGIATQTGGNFNVTTHLYLGLNGAQGTYRLKGGTLSVGSNIFGGTGQGTMVIDGGTLSLGGSIFNVTNLVLGDEQAGSWTLGAGKTLTVFNHIVGKNTTGSFTQSGGINNAGTLTLGQTSGSGTYLITGGTLNVSGQVVDGTGTGTLQIDGGTFAPSGNVAVDNLKVGITAAGSHTQTASAYSVGTLTLGNGTYRLAGGTLAAGGVSNTTGTGTLNLDGGTFNPSGAVAVDNLGVGIASAGSHNQTVQAYSVGALTLGNGTYTLSGGSLAVSGDVVNTTGTGTLQIDGGALSTSGNVAVDNLKVGISAAGSHSQTTGTYSVGTLTLGDGSYRLTGGTLAAGGIANTTGTGTLNIDGGTLSPSGAVAVDNLGVGIASAGSHNQSGQTYSVGTLTLGSGAYTLSGGTLAVSGNIVNGTGTGTLALNGGTFSPAGAVNVDNLHVGENATASHTLASGTWQAGALAFGVQMGGNGTLSLDGGTLNVAGNVTVGSGTGTLILNGGTFNGAGSVTVTNLNLANTTDVSFTQSANTYTAASLLLGMSKGRSGTWRLDGGTLNVGSIPDSPGTSTLILNGGTLAASGDIQVDHMTLGLTKSATHEQTGYGITVANNLSLGYDSTYKLSGGSLNVSGTIGGGNATTLNINGGTLTAGGDVSVMHLVVGDDKSGAYAQSGHTWAVGDSMTLGRNAGGYGSYTLSAGTLSVKNTLTIGSGGTGRLDWQGGTLAAGAMEFGTSSTLALGFGVTIESLADGSLYGSSQAPGHLERATLELARGSSSHLTTDLAVRELKIAVGFGTASYSMQGGSLTTTRLEVGSMGMVQGAFTQNGGTVTVANALVVGNMAGASGTYQFHGGTLDGSAGLSLRPFGGPGDATFRGYGNVNLTGTLTNNGRVVADGLGQSRNLDLSMASAVINSFENQVGDRYGWAAENGGRLTLPTILINSPGGIYNWGESPAASGELTIDLVNSVQFTINGVASGASLTGSLLAADNASVPALPGGFQVIGIWNFDLTTTFDSARLMFRYDDVLARAMGIIDENQLDVLHYENGEWQVVTGMRDLTNKWIATEKLTSLSPFAVGVIPEPRSLMLLALGSLLMLRRKA